MLLKNYFMGTSFFASDYYRMIYDDFKLFLTWVYNCFYFLVSLYISTLLGLIVACFEVVLLFKIGRYLYAYGFDFYAFLVIFSIVLYCFLYIEGLEFPPLISVILIFFIFNTISFLINNYFLCLNLMLTHFQVKFFGL